MNTSDDRGALLNAVNSRKPRHRRQPIGFNQLTLLLPPCYIFQFLCFSVEARARRHIVWYRSAQLNDVLSH